MVDPIPVNWGFSTCPTVAVVLKPSGSSSFGPEVLQGDCRCGRIVGSGSPPPRGFRKFAESSLHLSISYLNSTLLGDRGEWAPLTDFENNGETGADFISALDARSFCISFHKVCGNHCWSPIR